MWRFIVLLVTALLVADTTGALAESDDAECCRDDHGDKQECPTTCPTCPCAWHALRTAPVAEVRIVSTPVVEPAVETPGVVEVRGELAPAPITRPPIA